MAPSFWQIAIIVLIIFVLFGAGKLPRIMGDLAEGIKSFKKGMKDEEGSEKADPKALENTENKDKE
ncbi:MAG: Sec-independent protein translocase subunit TatA [Pseudomonadota bacterium]|jgi:sec-independent protein translocase protein TatA|nr:twin-arginine translocase TatA/TatE family subunit [Alphaproteobacteria bacterium]MEC7577037.1 Sec-independent protein translocase subunit TatA [Pseudomonadota bacterium]MCS5596603.1 Sec-independent protein translocase subunit TatA [Alphaproteobacteria bacterium]MEC7702386.1 Sec-independent protein translocase subunit TatA [Pseudomonadota bacterium]MEC9236395.1 Sec-independent protein translocase subunit TatA [Pseudomonadota bacterium]|tara:strand:+ start:521 stop:718 length:198 start_codon:yes stop_codon:yes gene_type:complete